MEENIKIYKNKWSFTEFFLKYLLKFIISAVLAVVIFGIILAIRGVNYTGISDGLFVAGCIFLAVGALSIITNLGFFDIFGYNASRFNSLLHKYKDNPYHGVYEYTEAKKEKRKRNRYTFISYVIVGAVFLIAAIIYTNVVNIS